MKTQLIAVAVASAFFGFVVGWILGSQQTMLVHSAASQSVQPASQQAAPASTAKPIDETQTTALRAAAQQDPNASEPRIELGNAYFDAEQWGEAAKWYEQALGLQPRDVNVSTDLAVCYYNLNEPDKALQQFDYSLKIDPKHLKTLLNQGIVQAFGKQDLQAAAVSWQKVIDLAPSSEEGQVARRMLDAMKSAHPATGERQTAPKGGD
jgi:cytochrome c-type biogenesis protein CcmH/NrfG